MVFINKLEQVKRQVCCFDIYCGSTQVNRLLRVINFVFLLWLLLYHWQCIAELSTKTSDNQSLRSTKKLLNRVHDSIIFCLENLGLWGAIQVRKFNSSFFISFSNYFVLSLFPLNNFYSHKKMFAYLSLIFSGFLLCNSLGYLITWWSRHFLVWIWFLWFSSSCSTCLFFHLIL